MQIISQDRELIHETELGQQVTFEEKLSAANMMYTFESSLLPVVQVKFSLYILCSCTRTFSCKYFILH